MKRMSLADEHRRPVLTRRDVEAIHACVAACNPREMIDGRDVRGPHDELVEKLRALWTFVDADGLRLGGRFCGMCGERVCAPERSKSEPGAPDTVVVDPTISAEAGDGGHAAQGDPASLPTLGPETALSPAAADSRSTSTQKGEKPSPCGSDVGGCSSDDTASYRLGSTSSARPGGERCGPATSNVEAHAPAKDDASDGGDPGLRPGAVSPPAAADSTSGETSTETGDPGLLDSGDGLEEAPSPARREPGFPESPAVLASAPSGSPDAEREGQVRDEGSPGDAVPPAPAGPIAVAGGRVALRTETIDAIFSGGAGMSDPEQQFNKRRRARTRAV